MKIKYSVEQINNNNSMYKIQNSLLTLELKKSKPIAVGSHIWHWKMHQTQLESLSKNLTWGKKSSSCDRGVQPGQMQLQSRFWCSPVPRHSYNREAQKHKLEPWGFLNYWNMDNCGKTSRARKLYSRTIISSVNTGGLILFSTTVIEKVTVKWELSHCKKKSANNRIKFVLPVNQWEQHLLCSDLFCFRICGSPSTYNGRYSKQSLPLVVNDTLEQVMQKILWIAVSGLLKHKTDIAL